MDPTSLSTGLDWIGIFMGLFGGLALFLYGMDLLAKGLQSAAGGSMKYVLSRLTSNRVLGAITGAFVTAVLNSSSVTTVLVVGFITAGVMSLSQSIGVIMGANVGSTFTAQIIAFDVTRYALGLIAIGFLILFVGKRDRFRQIGAMLMGLGMLFFGMGVMGDAMTPLRDYPAFLEFMARLRNPALGILVGAGFTGLVQSSAATTGIAIVLASSGLMPLEAGISLVLGANVGTCVTALLAAIGKPVEARRAAAAHVLFNVLGVVIWLGFVDQLAALATRISPAHPELAGADRMAAEVPRQIANAHTVFNVTNAVLFLPLTGVLAALVTRMVPDRVRPPKRIIEPKYLDRELVGSPSLALELVRREVGRLGEIALGMLRDSGPAMASGTREPLDALERTDDKVDVLHRDILEYLGEIQQTQMSDREGDDFLELTAAAHGFENIGDVVYIDIGGAGRKWIQRDLPRPSEEMQDMSTALYDVVLRATDKAIRAIRDQDEVAAHDVLSMKHEVNDRLDQILRHQAARLGIGGERPSIFRLEMEIIEALKRVYSLAKRIARLAIPAGPELEEES